MSKSGLPYTRHKNWSNARGLSGGREGLNVRFDRCIKCMGNKTTNDVESTHRTISMVLDFHEGRSKPQVFIWHFFIKMGSMQTARIRSGFCRFFALSSLSFFTEQCIKHRRPKRTIIGTWPALAFEIRFTSVCMGMQRWILKADLPCCRVVLFFVVYPLLGSI